MAINVRLTGKWDEAQVLLQKHRTGIFLRKAFDVAIKRQAQEFRKEVVQGIKAGSPGGKKLAFNAPLTIAKKGSTKPLIDSGSLWRAIKVQKVRRAEYFVGVLRQTPGAKKKGGGSGPPLVNLADLHENGGTIAIKVTKRMQRFFFALLRKLGKMRRGKKTRKTALNVARAGGSSGKFKEGQTLVITIPKRPFMQPVYDKFKRGIGDRVMREVVRELGGDFGWS